MPAPPQRFTDLNNLSLSLQLGSYRSELLNWGFFESCWWRNYLHIHSCFEVCYAFAGEGVFRSSHVDYTVQSGQVFIARPGDIHEIVSSEHAPLGIYFWSYSLLPSSRLAMEDDNQQAIDTLLTHFCQVPQVVSARVPTMLRTLELLTDEVVQRDPGYTLVIEGLVAKLLLDTARAVVDTPLSIVMEPLARGQDEAIVQTILRYLRDNYNRPLVVRDLAAQVHLSERHTSRLFQKLTGESIMSYLTRLRIEIAAQRLLEKDVAIKEIALEVGYPDVRYFITLFHRHMGLTPAVFRNRRGTRFLVQQS